MNHLTVESTGVLSLLQDAGRFGQHHLGLTTGGPLDSFSFYWANKLVGNHFNATCIEHSMGGLSLRASNTCVIAVTGANMPITVNGITQPAWQTLILARDDVLTLGYSTAGNRCYIAIQGGFNITPQFGSTSTVMREGIGGIAGKSLAPNDKLCFIPTTNKQRLKLPEHYQPHFSNTISVRVMIGYQHEAFSHAEKHKFFASQYTVTNQCDRMGYRLKGAAIASTQKTMLSEGICLGAIQIPADGQPIVLLNDRQTIGGYPKIGSVLSIDLNKLAQTSAGDHIGFQPISHYCAHNALHLNQLKQHNMKAEIIG